MPVNDAPGVADRAVEIDHVTSSVNLRCVGCGNARQAGTRRAPGAFRTYRLYRLSRRIGACRSTRQDGARGCLPFGAAGVGDGQQLQRNGRR
jgi:hypothetical protein